MSVQEQQEMKEKYYAEAMCYMDNAKEYLKQAQKGGKIYRNPKYVRTACGTAYNGVLIALDCYLMLKGVKKPSKKDRKSTVSERSRTIEFYQKNLAKLDRKMLDYLNMAYQILHLYGYYDGIEDTVVVKRGFDLANAILEKINPAMS